MANSRKASHLASENFRRHLRAARKARDWTRQQLAERVTEAGGTLSASTIDKIERGKRGVTIDDVIELCFALSVAPLQMIVPWGDEPFDLTDGPSGVYVEDAYTAKSWIAGAHPIPVTTQTEDEDDEFYYRWRPYEELGELFEKGEGHGLDS